MIANRLSAPDFRTFWKPGDFRGHCIKWIGILLPVLVSIYIFLSMLEPIQDYESACRNPVIVEAETEIVPVRTSLSGSMIYDIYLSYEYGGASYSRIYYRYSKSPAALWNTEKSLSVALDPEHPEILLKYMLRKGPIQLAILLWTVGSSALLYALALNIPAFCRWRVRSANKPVFFARPYGKSRAEVSEPDFLKDIALMMLPVYLATIIPLSFIFPYTFSISR